MAKKWKYESYNKAGNIHEATVWVNENHQDWDVVTLDHTFIPGAPGPERGVTAIVYRTEIITEEK